MATFTRRSAVATLMIAPFVVACGATRGSTTSRVRLYDSLAEMADDSDKVAVVRVRRQWTAADITPETDFTLSEVEAVLSRSRDGVGDRLVVRQFGSSNQPAPVPLLKVGRAYLLFLTSSGLEGELASHYYVTGSNAGIFVSRDASLRSTAELKKAQFHQVLPTPGERIPQEISWADV